METLSCSNPFFNSPVYRLRETDSTMEDAAALADRGASSGTIVAADYQRRGRGRLPGRQWEAAAGTSLLFTLILSAEDIPGGVTALPLRCGLGLALLLEGEWGLEPRIKWPNDLLVDGRKVAGILCQGRGGRVLVGMGINLRHGSAPTGLARPAACLADFGVDPPDPAELLSLLLPRLKAGIESVRWRRELEARLHAAGRRVVVTPGDGGSGSYSAVIRGLTDAGALELEEENGGHIELVSGEIDYR